MKYSQYLLFFFISVGLAYSNSGLIEGTVVDEYGIPLQYVNVYINASTFGSVTDVNGHFQINNIPFRKIVLVAQLAGYESYSIDLVILDHAKQFINIKLKEQINLYNFVEVIGKDGKEWRSLFKKFKKNFFGNSKLAKKCEIINKYDLDFRLQNDSIFVSSEKPIRLINSYLGYEILITLVEYIDSKKSGLSYQVNYHFKDLARTKESMKYEIRRAKIYYHSPKHFFKSLYHRKLKYNNFVIGKYTRAFDRFMYFDTTFNEDSVLASYHIKGFKEVKLKQKLTIKHLYMSNTDWYNQKIPQEKKFSHLKNLHNSKVIISSNGEMLNSNLIENAGYFAFYRFSGKLPLDYAPKPKILKSIINGDINL